MTTGALPSVQHVAGARFRVTCPHGSTAVDLSQSARSLSTTALADVALRRHLAANGCRCRDLVAQQAPTSSPTPSGGHQADQKGPPMREHTAATPPTTKQARIGDVKVGQPVRGTLVLDGQPIQHKAVVLGPRTIARSAPPPAQAALLARARTLAAEIAELERQERQLLELHAVRARFLASA